MNGRRRSTKSESGNPTLYQWSTQSFTLDEIVDDFKLPCVVKCDVSDCSLTWENFSFDMTQPLLLYTSRSVEKVKAKSTQYDEITRTHFQYGPDIVIPYDYDGWFAILSNDRTAVNFYKTVEDLAKSKSEGFLNTTLVIGLVVAANADGEEEDRQRPLIPGEILRKGGPHVREELQSYSRRSGTKKFKRKYLKCYDEKDVEILLAYDIEGEFYEVNEPCGSEARKSDEVNLLKDLMPRNTPPFRVQLVYGQLPPLMRSFSRLLSINKSFVEQTVVAASVERDHSLLLELSLSSSARYNIALNDFRLHAFDGYQTALDLCNSSFENYVSSMKLAFTLHPSTTESDVIQTEPDLRTDLLSAATPLGRSNSADFTSITLVCTDI